MDPLQGSGGLTGGSGLLCKLLLWDFLLTLPSGLPHPIPVWWDLLLKHPPYLLWGREQGCEKGSRKIPRGNYLEGTSDLSSLVQRGSLIERKGWLTGKHTWDRGSRRLPLTAFWIGCVQAPLGLVCRANVMFFLLH